MRELSGFESKRDFWEIGLHILVIMYYMFGALELGGNNSTIIILFEADSSVYLSAIGLRFLHDAFAALSIISETAMPVYYI